jgi:hypothetical protein
MEQSLKKPWPFRLALDLALGFAAILGVNVIAVALKWLAGKSWRVAGANLVVVVSMLIFIWAWQLVAEKNERRRAEERRRQEERRRAQKKGRPEPQVWASHANRVSILPFFLIVIVASSGALILAKLIAPVLRLALKFDFAISFLLITATFLPTLRRSIISRQSWKKLNDTWLKWSGVSAAAVGGFGFVGTNKAIESSLLKLALDRSQVGLKVLVGSYLLVVLLLGVAALFKTVGVASAVDENTYEPLAWFAPAFGCAWLGNVGLFSLFLDSVMLTLASHFGI